MSSVTISWTNVVAFLLCTASLLLLYLPLVSDALSWTKRWRRCDEDPFETVGSSRLLFLVPAHNEAGSISGCVNSLVQMDYPEDARRIVVIADNCVDATAENAQTEGAACLVRTDPVRRGKPHALAWALDQVGDLNDWDACVVIDADTTVQADFAKALSSSGPLREVAAQAYFDVINPADSWLTRLGKILATVRYEILFPLKSRAGLNCPLTGNGMCIGTDLLRSGWTAFSQTENWELYAQYTAEGRTIRYVPGARLLSEEAASMAGGSTQRKRWLAGRLKVLHDWFPRLIRSKNVSLHQKLDALAELANPGPVLSALMAIGTTSLALVYVEGAIGFTMATAAMAALVPLELMTVRSIARQEDPWTALSALVFLPAYAVWRLLTAIMTIKTLRSGDWRKTPRS